MKTNFKLIDVHGDSYDCAVDHTDSEIIVWVPYGLRITKFQANQLAELLKGVEEPVSHQEVEK